MRTWRLMRRSTQQRWMNDPLLRIISRRDLKKSSSTTAKWAKAENAKAFTTTVKPILTATAQPGKEFLVTRNFLIPKVIYVLLYILLSLQVYNYHPKHICNHLLFLCREKVENYHDWYMSRKKSKAFTTNKHFSYPGFELDNVHNFWAHHYSIKLNIIIITLLFDESKHV